MENKIIPKIEKEIEKLNYIHKWMFVKEKVSKKDIEFFKKSKSIQILKAQLSAFKKSKKIFDEMIDGLDIELFLEEVVDEKGNKVKVPKEIFDLWDIYWEHIKEELKQKLNEQFGENEK